MERSDLRKAVAAGLTAAQQTADITRRRIAAAGEAEPADLQHVESLYVLLWWQVLEVESLQGQLDYLMTPCQVTTP